MLCPRAARLLISRPIPMTRTLALLAAALLAPVSAFAAAPSAAAAIRQHGASREPAMLLRPGVLASAAAFTLVTAIARNASRRERLKTLDVACELNDADKTSCDELDDKLARLSWWDRVRPRCSPALAADVTHTRCVLPAQFVDAELVTTRARRSILYTNEPKLPPGDPVV